MTSLNPAPSLLAPPPSGCGGAAGQLCGGPEAGPQRALGRPASLQELLLLLLLPVPDLGLLLLVAALLADRAGEAEEPGEAEAGGGQPAGTPSPPVWPGPPPFISRGGLLSTGQRSVM